MKTVFNDTCFPSEIMQVDDSGVTKRKIQLSTATTAKEMYQKSIKDDLDANMDFKKLREFKFITRAIELFEPEKITIEEK